MRSEELNEVGADVPFGGTGSDFTTPLFSLPVGEGIGALFAAVAGDVAGAADTNGYSAVTQVSTVVAYHIMQTDPVNREKLKDELLMLDGIEGAVRCYRGESPTLRAWLESAHTGRPVRSADTSVEPAAWMAAPGVWFRNDAAALVETAVSISSLVFEHAPSIALAAAAAGAVAGSCFVQSGRDLVLGAAETAERAVQILEAAEERFIDIGEAGMVGGKLRELAPLVSGSPREIVAAVAADNGPEGCEGSILGILLGASRSAEPVKLIEAGAMSGGSEVGAIVGAIIGARSGLVRWPWRIPNDTWFAELGRRLVRGVTEVRDLPVPFAVEERLTLAIEDLPSNEVP